MGVRAAVTGVSLFSGGGGLDLGLSLALGGRLRCLAYCEREASAVALLASRMERGDLDAAPVWDDAFTFPVGLYRGVVDIVYGGVPCQPFSYAGKRKGGDDERDLWPCTLGIVGAIQPREFFGENVPGSLPYLYGEVIPKLQGMGYRVAAGLFSAAEVGAPHLRQRVFVLGRLADSQGSRLGWAQSEERRPDECRDLLADAERWRCDGRAHEPERRQDRGAATASTGGDVGQPLGARRPETGGRRAQHPRAQPEPGGSCMGNAERLGGGACRAEQEHREQGRSWPQYAGLPAWPPGPADRDAWAAILARWTELAPALSVQEEAELQVRGVVDGLAPGMGGLSRTQKLRILGNGCVPSVVQLAYKSLSARFKESQEAVKDKP